MAKPTLKLKKPQQVEICSKLILPKATASGIFRRGEKVSTGCYSLALASGLRVSKANCLVRPRPARKVKIDGVEVLSDGNGLPYILRDRKK
jgi:hypothetical protein